MTMFDNIRDWLPIAAVVLVSLGYLVSQWRQGHDNAVREAEHEADAAARAADEASRTALAAQAAQIEVQNQTIAGLRYELANLRDEMTAKSTRAAEDIARLQTQVEALTAELRTTQERNIQLNQMPPFEQLQALAADVAVRITELIGERMHSLEQGMARLLTAGATVASIEEDGE